MSSNPFTPAQMEFLRGLFAQSKAMSRYRQGKIIDGRHRYLASQEAGVEPVIRKLADDATLEDAVGEVTKANMLRRQLSVAERAMVAGKLANMSEGRPQKNTANLQSIDSAAKQLNVSPRSVAEVRKIKNEAPEVYAKLERGEIKSINAASKEAFQRSEQKPSPAVQSQPTAQGQTAEGAATTLMGVLKAIDENFDLRAVHKVGHKVGLTIGA